jgi:hypothetical protein
MTTPSPIQLIEKDHRRRRWFIRLSLFLLVLLAGLGITAAIVLRSPTLPLDELRARLKALPREAGLAELKQLLGEPTEVNTGNMVWMLSYHTWNTTDSVVVTANDTDDNAIRFRTMVEMHVDGLNAWTFRWALLMRKLGWK